MIKIEEFLESKPADGWYLFSHVLSDDYSGDRKYTSYFEDWLEVKDGAIMFEKDYCDFDITHMVHGDPDAK